MIPELEERLERVLASVEQLLPPPATVVQAALGIEPDAAEALLALSDFAGRARCAGETNRLAREGATAPRTKRPTPPAK